MIALHRVFMPMHERIRMHACAERAQENEFLIFSHPFVSFFSFSFNMHVFKLKICWNTGERERTLHNIKGAVFIVKPCSLRLLS